MANLMMYVSLQEDDKIALFAIDGVTGRLTRQGEFAVLGGPAPLAIDPTKRFLYAGRRGACVLSSFSIEPGTGRIAQIGEVRLATDPCFLSTDRTGRFVLASYYEGRGITIHAVGSDGAAVGPPVEKRETARGAHSIQTDPSNRFAFVSHIAGGRGPNAIYQFRFDAETGRLTPNTPPELHPEQPDGPRHFCFHPTRDIVYFSNEQGCSVTAYALDTSGGVLSPFQTVSTLPEGYSGGNSCSKIRITPSAASWIRSLGAGKEIRSMVAHAIRRDSKLRRPEAKTMPMTSTSDWFSIRWRWFRCGWVS